MTTDDQPGGGEQHVCGSTGTGDGEPCQFPVSGPDDTCHMHPDDGSGPPDGHGSGSPDHRMGDGDGKIQDRLPDNAKPNMGHGIHAVKDDPRGTLQWLEDNDPRGYDWVIDKWRSYMVDAPFDAYSAKADDLMEVCLMKYAVRGARQEQVEVGLTKMMRLQSDDVGDIDMNVEQELPANLPANRMAREARSILKDLGLLDDPESQKAEAMGWGAAAREVAMEVDSDVQGGGDA